MGRSTTSHLPAECKGDHGRAAQLSCSNRDCAVISRRHVIPATAAGLLVGSIAGIVGTQFSQNEASIRFIGRRNTIFALLDTGTGRVLILLGEHDDELLNNLPALKSFGSRRIDLVVATHRFLTTRAARETLNLNTTAALSVQANLSLSPIRGDIIPVPSRVAFTIGNDTNVDVLPIASGADTRDHPDFVVEVNCRGVRMLLTSNERGLRHADSGPFHLLAVTGTPGEIANSRLASSLIVSNLRTTNFGATTQVQVYPSEPVIVGINHDALQIREDQLSS